MPEPVIAVVGPTAAGKSDLALGLAHALGGEVVNADSMQLYTGMDIGTAKLAPAQRRGVPHHLLDIWDVRQTASVAEYQRLARAAIGDIQRRGRVPVLAGGSGLYVRAALDPLEFPGTDPELRARLEAELARSGPEPLYARLTSADPAAAAAILPSNGRRIVRALEVIEVSGQPFSATAGPLGCSPPGWSKRFARWNGPGCGRGGRPAVPWATRRCCGSSPGSARRRKRSRRPSWRPSGSCGGRSPGSAATPGSPGCRPVPRTPVTCWSAR